MAGFETCCEQHATRRKFRAYTTVRPYTTDPLCTSTECGGSGGKRYAIHEPQWPTNRCHRSVPPVDRRLALGVGFRLIDRMWVIDNYIVTALARAADIGTTIR
jgi:hypothetical protein